MTSQEQGRQEEALTLKPQENDTMKSEALTDHLDRVDMEYPGLSKYYKYTRSVVLNVSGIVLVRLF
jgi:hypothetical protein